MPELPEVELARRDLTRWTAGQTIKEVGVADPTVVRRKLSTRPADALDDGADRVVEALRGARTVAVVRAGKRIGWRFDSGMALLVHLGMSGKWVRRTGETMPHTRLRLSLSDGSDLLFVDPRRFGCVVPLPAEDLERALGEGLGPDALDAPLDAHALAQRLAGRGAIRNNLLDQQRIAGVGNIQAAEALFRAGIRPDRAGTSLGDAEWERLSVAIPEQLRWTLDVEADGEIVYLSEWGSRNPFAVYGREGEPCPRCGAIIERSVLSGRSSFWCPSCQG